MLGKNVDHIGIGLKNPTMSLVLDEKKHKSDASRKLFHQALNFVASNVELVTYNIVIHYGVFIVSNLTINMFNLNMYSHQAFEHVLDNDFTSKRY